LPEIEDTGSSWPSLLLRLTALRDRYGNNPSQAPFFSANSTVPAKTVDLLSGKSVLIVITYGFIEILKHQISRQKASHRLIATVHVR
jgi:hypothetical protein